MRWMLRGNWPIGAGLIPAGTVISDDGEPSAIPLGEVPTPLPIVAMATDPPAALQMAVWYDEAATVGGWHQLHFAPGIDREAVLAKARHKKRWPNGEPVPSAPPPSPTPTTTKRSAVKG